MGCVTSSGVVIFREAKGMFRTAASDRLSRALLGYDLTHLIQDGTHLSLLCNSFVYNPATMEISETENRN